MRPIRVLNVTSSPYATGGVETLLLHMADRYHSDFDVRYCNLFFPQSTFIDALRDLGCMVTSIGAPNWIDLPATVLRLTAFLRRDRPDIVHSHMLHSTVVAQLAASIARVPVRIVSRHYTDSQHPPPLICSFEHRLARRAMRVIAVSNAIADELAAAGVDRGRISVVHNGIALDYVDRHIAANDVPWPKEWNDTLLLGTVGNLYRYKGHAELVEAFAIVAEERSDARLVIVGEGAERARLESLVREYGLRERVWLTGRQSNVPALLRRLKIYVHPSRAEPFGIAVLEAMAVGLPVVSTCVGGLPEVVADGTTGVLVSPNDPAGLAAAILRMAADYDSARAMGREGRARVERDFTIAASVEKTEAVYRSAIERNGGRGS